jgi:hypothetical protein
MLNISDIINKEAARAARREAHSKSFIARNFWLWVVVAYLVYPLASIFSALTEGGHIFLRAKAALGEGPGPIVITAILVLLIELLKFFLGKGAVDDLQANPFSQGGSTLAAFFVKALGFIGIMAFSVTLSVQGAEVINNYMRKNYQPVSTDASYVDENAIIARYEQELLPHRQNIQQYQTIRWKGTITVDARRMIRKEQDQVDKILAARDAELARVRANNDELKGEWKEETEANGNYAMGFAGVGEVICLLAIIFIGVYDDGIRREVLSRSPSSAASHRYDDDTEYRHFSSAAASVPPPPPPTPSYEPARRKIGFVTHDDPPTPDIRMNDTVATGSYSVGVSESHEHSLEVNALIGAYKNAVKNAQASRAKKRKGEGKPESNEKRAQRYEEEAEEYAQLLREKGVEV